MRTSDIRMLALSLTGRCNFSCRYCYASEHTPMDMPFAVAKQAIDLVASDGKPFILQFTGGEPLLNESVLRQAVLYVEGNKIPAQMRIQTNGSLLSEELVLFLYRHKTAIGVSLDGKPSVNDRLRLQQDGQGASVAIVRGIQNAKKHQIALGLTCVVSSDNVEELESCIDFAYFLGNIRRIGFDLLRGQGRGKGLCAPTEEQVAKAMERVKIRRDQLQKLTGIPIVLSQQERASVQKERGHEYEFGHCYAMNGQSAFVSPDGSIYACASFIGEESFCIGQVAEGVDEIRVEAVRRKILEAMQFCRECVSFADCGGGCYARWYGSGCRQAYPAECALKRSMI